MSAGQAGEPGPGDMTILSKASSSYSQKCMHSHAHSSLRTTTGGTKEWNQKITIVLVKQGNKGCQKFWTC